MHVKKKLISLLLALGMLGGTQTALAAEPAAQEAAPQIGRASCRERV